MPEEIEPWKADPVVAQPWASDPIVSPSAPWKSDPVIKASAPSWTDTALKFGAAAVAPVAPGLATSMLMPKVSNETAAKMAISGATATFAPGVGVALLGNKPADAIEAAGQYFEPASHPLEYGMEALGTALRPLTTIANEVIPDMGPDPISNPVGFLQAEGVLPVEAPEPNIQPVDLRDVARTPAGNGIRSWPQFAQDAATRGMGVFVDEDSTLRHALSNADPYNATIGKPIDAAINLAQRARGVETPDVDGHQQRNMPEWMYGTPEKTPEFGKVVNKVLPSAVEAHKNITGDDTGTMFEKDGSVKWGQAIAQTVDFGRDLYLMGKVDPAMGLHPGISKAGQAEAAARTGAVADVMSGVPKPKALREFIEGTNIPKGGGSRFADSGGIGKFGQWATDAEREAFANPGLASQVAKGQVGLNYKFGPIDTFLPIPKKFAPAFKFLEPIVNAVKKPILGESARSANQVGQKVSEAPSRADTNQFMRDNVTPILEDWKTRKVSEDYIAAASTMMESANEDGFIRMPGVPTPIQARFNERVQKLPEAVRRRVEAEYDAGPEHLEPQQKAVVEYASTLPMDEQAKFWGDVQGLAKLGKKVRDFTESPERGTRGFKTPDLNAEIKDKPGKWLDVLDTLDELESKTTPIPAGAKERMGVEPLKFTSPRLKELYQKLTSGNELDTPQLDALLSELRNERVPKAEAPLFEMDPVTGKWKDAKPVPEPARTPDLIADELLKSRQERDLAATLKKANQRQPSNPGGTNKLTTEEINELRNAIHEQLPVSFKRANAVANYRPLQISEFTKEEMAKDTNANTTKPGAPQSTEDMQRGTMLKDISKKYEDMGDVKATYTESQDVRSKGTPSTAGLSVDQMGPGDRFLTKVGLDLWRDMNVRQKTQQSAGKPFFIPNAAEAFGNQIQNVINKTLTNKGVENAALLTMDVVPPDLTNVVRQTWYNGIDTGRMVDKTKQYGSWKRGRELKADPSLRASGMNTNEWLGTEDVMKGKDAPPAPKGRVFDQDPFVERAEAFATDTRVDHGPWRSGMPNESPTDWYNRAQEPLPTPPESPKTFKTGADYDKQTGKQVEKVRQNDRLKRQFSELDRSVKPEPTAQDFNDYLKRRGLEGANGNTRRTLWAEYLKEQHADINAKFQAKELPREQFFQEGPQLKREGTTSEPAVFQGKQELVPETRPATLEDMEAIWNKSGRKDTFFENLMPEAQKKLQDGVPLEEVLSKDWTPAGRQYVEWGDKKGFIHKKVAEDVNNYKRLGQDPLALGRWIRLNAPLYHQYITAQKKASTLYGINAPAYIMQNIAGDLVRNHIAGGTDMLFSREAKSGLGAHIEYHKSGKIDKMPAYNAGKLGVMKGPDALRFAERNGVLGDASTRTASDVQNQVPGIVQGKQVGEVFENLLKGAETNNRMATFFKFLRDGNKPFEAAFKTNQIYFDFTRTGSLTRAGSQTGVVPFGIWHMKIVPFMAKWAMENPGQFMLTMKALTAAGADRIPRSQWPSYLRSRTNIPLGSEKDEQGHTQLTTLPVTSDVPGQDIVHFADSVVKNGGMDWLEQHLGNMPRAAVQQFKLNDKEKRDDEGVGLADRAKALGKTLIGKPWRDYENLTDPEKQTMAERLNMTLNPMPWRKVDITESSQIARSNAENAFNSARFALREANVKLTEMQKKFPSGGYQVRAAKEAVDKAQQVLKAKTAQKQKVLEESKKVPK